MTDLSPHFYRCNPTPFNSFANSDLCDPPISSNEDAGESQYAMIVPYNNNPAYQVALQIPISASNSIHYSSTLPVEYPDSDTEDFSTSISSYPKALNQTNNSI